MAIAKVILNNETLMDVTQLTVDSANLLYNITALKNDGTSVTGTIATKTNSDITLPNGQGDTITLLFTVDSEGNTDITEAS